MNIQPDNSIVVVDIVGNMMKLRVQGGSLLNRVKLLGFLHSGDFMIKIVGNESDKLDIIKELAKLDALFLFGYGWYPSEVMGFYKDKGIYTGKYKVISWSGPNHYEIEEK